MFEKDQALRATFERLVRAQTGAAAYGACKVLTDGEVYLVNRCCVYKGAPVDSEVRLEPEKFVRFADDVPEGRPVELNNIRPEVLLSPTQVMLDDGDCATNTVFLPVLSPPKGAPPAGLWVADLGESGVATFQRCIEFPDMQQLARIPLRITSIPDVVLSVVQYGYGMSQLQACMMYSRPACIPVIVLRGETGLLYSTMSATSSRESLASLQLPDGVELVGDGWSDNTHTYKKLIKKKGSAKMRGIGNPLAGKLPAAKLKADVPGNEQAAQTAAEAAARVAEAAMAEQEAKEAQESALSTADQADTGGTPQAETSETTPEVANTPAPADANDRAGQDDPADDDPVHGAVSKRSRAQRAPRAVGLDLAKIIEDIGAPVTGLAFDQFESAQVEIRNLRDLQIAVARRMANISAELCKASKVAVDKYTAIQQLLK